MAKETKKNFVIFLGFLCLFSEKDFVKTFNAKKFIYTRASFDIRKRGWSRKNGPKQLLTVLPISHYLGTYFNRLQKQTCLFHSYVFKQYNAFLICHVTSKFQGVKSPKSQITYILKRKKKHFEKQNRKKMLLLM